MPPQSPETINLQSTSSKKWSFTVLRPLSSSVQLVRTSSSSKYALKTLTARSDEHVQQALDDAEIWQRAHAACPTNILNLHDVVVDSPNVYYIMEYCPTGDLTTVRSESSALRCLAAIATALEVVLSDCNQPAHANLSAKNILLDASGNPKLGGWGILRSRRLKNPNRSITERDDVRALAAILYEMLYGRRFDVDNLKLPESPQVSRLTADLLRNVLYVRLKDIPELTVFRYDLAAARLLVPACTPALEPIINRRPEENLDIDLNSKRGVQSTSNAQAETVKPREVPKRPTLPQGGNNHQSEKSQNSANTTQAVQQQYMVEEQPDGMDINTNSGIDHAVRQMTHGDMHGIRAEELDFLVDSCARIEHLPDKIFRVLFRLPISKNPIVAFKAITVIHRLLSEGPSPLTALAITNDGFLNWIESSWSRDRLQNARGKVHMYSYCFSAGEVSWYTAVLRKRIEIHGRFAKVFSTHWVPRPAGLPNIRATRRDAFRLILNIAEKSSSLIRKTASAKDPAASVKQCAIPVLVAEVWKSYHAICWLYETAEDALKPQLYPELELAHNAAKSAIEVVKSLPHIVGSCPPHIMIDLSDQAPRNFDTAALIKSLKRKKKRRKKKPVSSDSNGESSGQQVRDEEAHENGEEQSEATGRDADTQDETARAKAKTKRRKGRKEKLDDNVEQDKESELSRVQNGAVGVASIQRQTNPQMSVPTVAQNGLHKLSLSVRRGVSRAPPERDLMAPDAHHASDDETSLEVSHNGLKSKPSRSRSRSQGRKEGRHRRSDDEEEGYDSTDESDERISEANNSKQPKEGLTEKRKRAKGKRREAAGSGSESEEERQTRSKSDSKKKKKNKKKKRQMKKAESSEGSSSESDTAQEKTKHSQKKAPTLKRTDEKSIPFDKEHPTGRRPAKKPDEEYTGGSKEALAAAAKGKKTPNMNPKFEIAPYEVVFGPQIGSGGFGVVYKAKFRNETVAVKKIHGHALSNAASVAEFQSEVAVLCTLSHPNILRFVGACTRPPNLMIITEFMSRGTLFDLLHQSNTRVTWPMRKKFALDTCKGMRYLHDSKLLHRDLKSSNLMIDKDFNCKVGDFGLTRISKGAAAVQMTGQCGTFQYMAVEVLANKPYSEKADVFSFGVLLWEMVARKLPYFGMQPMQVGIAVLQQGLRPTIPPKCPEPLAKLMRACWDSDPNRRPSFAQLMQALEAMPE